MINVHNVDFAAFPPQVLREYALLADGERGALVGPRGDIVWMCARRWDSGAAFSSLLGGVSGYSVTPIERAGKVLMMLNYLRRPGIG